jgi:uncharacterized surface protein with fasciclin (FAS1) repeats
MNAADNDVVANTEAAGKFSKFYNALRAAGLVATYKGPGPFTIFAPTDEAFDKLPEGALHALLKDRPRLTSIINNHVVNGTLLAKDIRTSDATSVQGETLALAANDDGFTVNGAKASFQEIESTNGVVHAIDTIMMPRA